MRRRHARWVSATAVVVAWALAPAVVASAQPAEPAAGERPVTVVQRWIPAGPDLKDGTASIRVVVADPAALASPVLLVADGAVTAGAEALAAVTVAGEVVAHTKGPKIVIHKFKNKTGYHKRQGHRQKLTKVKVTGITVA